LVNLGCIKAIAALLPKQEQKNKSKGFVKPKS
jgi:hypothetical protein